MALNLPDFITCVASHLKHCVSLCIKRIKRFLRKLKEIRKAPTTTSNALVNHFLSFPKLNLLEWHWLITYRFQVYISVTHDLYLALCACHSKSNLPSPQIWPNVPCINSSPFLLVTTILLPVSMRFCLCFSFVHFLLLVL